jgi:Domain of unknown function (DUF4145)
MALLPKRTQGWNGLQKIAAKEYTCPYCGAFVASDLGFVGGDAALIICPSCVHPTYFTEDGSQIPGPRRGADIDNVPPDVERAYEEARSALAANAPTASAMVSRKVLMHVAVDKGASGDETFEGYVQYLADKGWVPPNGKGWVDHIRTKGNEANHEIPQTTLAEATELIDFVELLLRFAYDMPARVPGASAPQP